MENLEEKICLKERLELQIDEWFLSKNGKEYRLDTLWQGKEFLTTDRKKFWQIIDTHFKFHSRRGTSVIPVFERRLFPLRLEIALNLKNEEDFFKRYNRIFEVGYGYGEFGIRTLINHAEYQGIDYIKEEYLNPKYFHEIDKSGVPNGLLKENYYDLFYCNNCLQHCTFEERRDYFKSAYDMLKPGGKLYFSLFSNNEETREEKYKNSDFYKDIIDYNRKYFPITFFNMETSTEWDDDLSKELVDIGFKIDIIYHSPIEVDTAFFLLTKTI